MPINHLSVERLSKSFNEKVLFNGLTFGIEQGQKVALVGINGSGKSTLLKILSGLESPDEGIVSFKKDIRVGHLQQSPDYSTYRTVYDAIYSADIEEVSVLREYHQLTSSDQPSKEEELQEILSQIDRLGAWDYEYQVKEILGKLGIHQLDQSIDSLSGGQLKRVALGSVLASKPDFIILDEPTNHLDLEIIEWLEDYLATQTLSLIMVTHDRYFLDKVTNHIIELENGQIYHYQGNYGYYLEKKAEREEFEQKSKQKAQNLMRKELDWIRRQPKARGTKAKYRIDAFQDLKAKANINLRKDEVDIQTGQNRMGKKILEVKGLSKSFQEKALFNNFDHIFVKHEKVGIIGKNGTGKSTFLNTLTGGLSPDSGQIDKGVNTQIGYYTQSEIEFDEGQKVIDVVTDIAENITLADGSSITASQFLNLFLFPPSTQHNQIAKLSGGEKRRLQLLQVLIANPNFLILDEPTNDLDIITLNVLEDYLEKFSGCLLVVSHDRYFMDRLVDHLFVFDETDQIRDFPGNYTDYRIQEDQKEGEKRPEKAKKAKVRTGNTNKLSYKEKMELEALDSELPKLEEQKESLLSTLNSGEVDHEKLQFTASELEKVTQMLDEKELRWLELSEKQ